MKSAYCIAIVSCLTVGWLYEEKRKHGIKGNLCWKSTVGYLITRLVFFLISNQEMRGYGATAAMDLVTAGMLYFLSQKSGNPEEAWERVYLYIWNPIPVLAVLLQGKTRMLLIWLTVMLLSLSGKWIYRLEQALASSGHRILQEKALDNAIPTIRFIRCF